MSDDWDWFELAECDYFATHYEDDLLERSNQDAWEDAMADMRAERELDWDGEDD